MRNLVLGALLLSACAHEPTTPTVSSSAAPLSATAAQVDYAAIVADPDRTPADRALDPQRKPAQFLAFTGVEPRWHVADLGSGGGYMAELFARAVGKKGVVLMQNSPGMLAKLGTKGVEDRLARAADQHVTRVDQDFETPIPADAQPLDLVVMNLFYHDTVWLKVDRDKMNAAIFAALKPGGRFVICDSSAKDGNGTADAQTLHRIDEKVVRDDLQKAGFALDGTSDLLRNPQDPRDWNTSPRAAGERRGTGDRFLLRFVKPAR